MSQNPLCSGMARSLTTMSQGRAASAARASPALAAATTLRTAVRELAAPKGGPRGVAAYLRWAKIYPDSAKGAVVLDAIVGEDPHPIGRGDGGRDLEVQ